MSRCPQRFLFALLTCVFAFGLCSARADEAEDVKEKLSQAKKTYDDEVQKFNKAVADLLDKREDDARQAGNKKLVAQIKAERVVFYKDGTPPVPLPTALRQQITAARANLDKAYTASVKAYIRLKMDAAAEAVEKEQKEFAADGFPSIAGVWQDGPAENKIQVVITQQRDKFTATCTYNNKEHGEISWRMTGTVTKDGELKGILIHTKSPPGWEGQTRTGKFSATGGTIVGRAEFKGGGHDFEWKLIKK
jgi:hypothetical protein